MQKNPRERPVFFSTFVRWVDFSYERCYNDVNGGDHTFDRYLYVATRKGAFAAGVGQCRITSSQNPVFLFTTLRILRVNRGSGKWKVGAKLLTIRTGDIVFVNNAEPRQFVAIDDAPLEADVFAISPAILDMEPTLISLFYGGFKAPIIRSDSEIGKSVARILDTVKDQATNEADLSGATVHLLLGAACLIKHAISHQLPTAHEALPPACAVAIARSIAMISERLEEISDVSVLAREVGISRSHFTVLFKQFTGTTPALYLRRARLERVIYLLKCENVNVLDAALACGFTSSSGFYRAFTSEFGVSPKEFLRQ